LDLQLKGKRALVTGASRGLGKAIARGLAEEGVDVVIAARNLGPLESAARELAGLTGQRIVPIAADTGDDASVNQLVAQAVREMGGLDILVNNAAVPGGMKVAKIAQLDNSRLLEDLNVKIGGYARTARAASPHMVSNGWGRIISIGGLAARRTGNYTAAIRGAAVSSLTKNLADELGPSGITAVAIHPGAMRGDSTTPEMERIYAAAASTRRIIEHDEIAWLVTMLASPRSVSINGQTIQAGGGTVGTIDY
jgi:NAD(P)-dependent dehydrogenase (short-subunit alcohol dehydrogenase family)